MPGDPEPEIRSPIGARLASSRLQKARARKSLLSWATKPLAERSGRPLPSFLGGSPELQLEENLKRAKELIESGVEDWAKLREAAPGRVAQQR